MVGFSEAQVLAWLAPVLWPALRALALLTTLPVLGQRSVPLRVRIGLALLLAVAAQPSLPVAAGPAVPLDSALAVALVLQQLLVGICMGFAVRVVFAGVELAGEAMGLQMGLNYAGFFDPASASSGTATARFMGAMVAWLFIVTNGHLFVLGALVASFQAFPVGPEPFAVLRAVQPQTLGAELFRLGVWIALPLLGMLLFVNGVLGIISRVAPQMNVFAVGFPLTLGVGLLGLVFTLPALQQPVQVALEQVLGRF
jgi:flagellar biosynthetic protein FliR